MKHKKASLAIQLIVYQLYRKRQHEVHVTN